MYCSFCNKEVEQKEGDLECPVCGRILVPVEEKKVTKEKKEKVVKEPVSESTQESNQFKTTEEYTDQNKKG